MSTVGVVGLGAMGSRIAGRFLQAGYRVVGTNRTAAKAGDLVERGLVWRDTPREVAQEADGVFSMVADDVAFTAITSGPDGILAGLQPGKHYVDMTTASPWLSRDLAARVSELGASMLDAPVSGSLPQAEAGTLTVLVGGDAWSLFSVEPLLRELGTVVHVGGNGQALVVKLAINISVAVQMLAFSEGVLFAERGGIDRGLATEVLADSAIGSPMLHLRAPFLLELPGQASFDARRLMRKDLRLALEAARDSSLPLPTASVAERYFTSAVDEGYGDRDIAVVYDVLAEMAAR